MAVKDYNTDPDLNTQISGINIAEGCAPSGINNAIRQLMADVKEESVANEEEVSSLDTSLRALIAEEVEKTMAVANAAQSSADAAQSSADAAQSSADAAQNSVPVGSLIMHAAGATPPGGFLFCNGAAVSRTTYAKLFEVIGVLFGKGDGKTTFNIPNCDSRFIEGGGAPGIIYKAGLPEIAAWWIGAYETHSNIPGGDSGWGNGAVRTKWDGYNNLEIPDKSNAGKMNYYFTASSSNGTYGASSTVQPPAITMCFFIKY